MFSFEWSMADRCPGYHIELFDKQYLDVCSIFCTKAGIQSMRQYYRKKLWMLKRTSCESYNINGCHFFTDSDC